MGFRQNTFDTEKLAKLLDVGEEKLKKAMKKSAIGGYARVWSVDNKDTYSICRYSTWKKKKDGSEDDYCTDFQDGYVMFSGLAHEKINSLDIPEKGLTIQVNSCEVITLYNEKKDTWNKFCKVYDFYVPESNKDTSNKNYGKTSKTKKEYHVDENEDDNELPF